MRMLKVYKEMGLDNEENVFDYLINSLSESIFMWNYFVDFVKVKKNVSLIETELCLLNVLIGKQNIEEEFIQLVKKYPLVRSVLPILVAIRGNKLNELSIIGSEDFFPENKKLLFDSNTKLNPELEKELIIFFRESGLKQIFFDKNIKNIVDYCFGVEVGLDTNARKNRTGSTMEKIVEKKLKKFSKENNLEYISQATKKKIKEKWGINIKVDKTNRIFDFVLFNKNNSKVFVFEINYYSSSGSKLKSTAGEYKMLNDFLINQGINFVWVTDGPGWRTTKKSLEETFFHINYLVNLNLLNQKILEEIIL